MLSPAWISTDQIRVCTVLFVRSCCDIIAREKSTHEVRKVTPTRAARNGAAKRQFEAIFGWSRGADATLCTQSATRGRLAAGAIGKLDRAQTEH